MVRALAGDSTITSLVPSPVALADPEDPLFAVLALVVLALVVLEVVVLEVAFLAVAAFFGVAKAARGVFAGAFSSTAVPSPAALALAGTIYLTSHPRRGPDAPVLSRPRPDRLAARPATLPPEGGSKAASLPSVPYAERG
jgi:hypothetical protein